MSEKQAAANLANALKSTGPKTAHGKAVVAMNGIRHGILSTRLLLASENPAEFDALVLELQAALRPVGALELMLVEKIAVAIWRQRRLVAAETASTELGRRLERAENRREVEKAANLSYGDFDGTASPAELSEEEQTQAKWCADALAEFAALDDAVLDANDLRRLEQAAPLMFGQLTNESAEEGQPVQQYIGTNLREWAEELEAYCRREQAKLSRKPMVQAVAALVQQKESAPITNELLCRYQAALDNELYKAIRALREQQEWRQRGGIEVEVEPEAELEAEAA